MEPCMKLPNNKRSSRLAFLKGLRWVGRTQESFGLFGVSLDGWTSRMMLLPERSSGGPTRRPKTQLRNDKPEEASLFTIIRSLSQLSSTVAPIYKPKPKTCACLCPTTLPIYSTYAVLCRSYCIALLHYESTNSLRIISDKGRCSCSMLSCESPSRLEKAGNQGIEGCRYPILVSIAATKFDDVESL